MTQLGRLTVQEIFDGASSTDPAPGAGSVMAMAAAWGVALALKSVRITHKHGKGGPETQSAEPELERVGALLMQDADDDATGFAAYVAALRRPRSDADREAAVSQAAAAIAETALRTLEHARAARAVCTSLQGKVLPVMDPDMDAAQALLAAASRTARQDAEESLDKVAPEELPRVLGQTPSAAGGG